ncbi:Uncharacterised protein [BD1-7 clade bacterium]|uniref:SSD domain-containing protein n=1 Tax=BD1-7 clade bacterium TaxID=2029982 RepID=A0A5S9MYY2_9GAMM|nr:Uncharacterised protein [BD1-7 clade bacterium]
MESAIIQHLFHARWRWFFISLVILVAASAGLKHLTFDSSTAFFFGEDHPDMQRWRAFTDIYGDADRALLMIQHKDGQSLLSDKKYLALIESATAELELAPHVVRVESLSNYQHSWAEDDDLYVEALIEDAADKSADDVQAIESLALNDPATRYRLVSPAGDATVVVMTANFDETLGHVEQQKQVVTTYVQQIRDQIRAQYPELNVYTNGNVVGNATTMVLAVEDIKLFIPLMYLVIYTLLAILLRSLLSMLTIAFTASFCAVSALGIASWLGITLSPLSISAVSIVVITTVAHCVHIVLAYLEFYRGGMEKMAAMAESYRINLQPVFFTSVTTALGFLSMNISEMQPSRDLGNIVAIGVVISFMFSLTLLPTFLWMMPVRSKANAESILNRISNWSSEKVIRHSHGMLWVSLLVSAGLAWAASTNIITERMTENIKPPHPYRTSTDAFDNALGGVYTLQYSIQAIGAGGISEPDYLNALDTFTQWLRKQPEITSVHSYVDVIKRLNRNMHANDSAWYQVPEDRQLASQYLLLYNFSLPAGQDLTNQINADESATRLVVSLPSMPANNMVDLQDRIYAWQQRHLPEYMRDYGTSDASMWSHLALNVLGNSLLSAFTALFFISLVLMGILRSFKYGVISLAPNMLPGIAGFGFWALYNGEINLALMNVLCITIGIVVDDTVHFLSKYIRARKEQGLNAEDAVRYAFRHVGPAILVTTLVLTLGFGSLTLSPFLANANMGMMIAIIIFAALIYDYFLLPALLLVLDRNGPAPSKP